MPARLALGVLCVAMNLWKTEKEIDTIHQSVEQRLPDFLRSKVPELPVSARLKVVREFTFRTPAVRDGKIVGTEIYDGPVDFYVRLLRRRGWNAEVVGRGYAHRPGQVIVGCGEAVRTAYRRLRWLMDDSSCFALGDPQTVAANARFPVSER